MSTIPRGRRGTVAGTLTLVAVLGCGLVGCGTDDAAEAAATDTSSATPTPRPMPSPSPTPSPMPTEAASTATRGQSRLPVLTPGELHAAALELVDLADELGVDVHTVLRERDHTGLVAQTGPGTDVDALAATFTDRLGIPVRVQATDVPEEQPAA